MPTNKTLANEILSRIPYALRELGMVFEEYIFPSSTKLEDSEPAVTLNSCSGTQNEHKIHRIILLRGKSEHSIRKSA